MYIIHVDTQGQWDYVDVSAVLEEHGPNRLVLRVKQRAQSLEETAMDCSEKSRRSHTFVTSRSKSPLPAAPSQSPCLLRDGKPLSLILPTAPSLILVPS